MAGIVDSIKANLKNRKTADIENWRYEYIKYAGKDLQDSLIHMINEVMETKQIPNQWKYMKIKSIYKKKGQRQCMKNQRGLFFTNVISKVVERMIYNRNQNRNGVSKYQCGSLKKRSTIDNLFVLHGAIDYHRFLKKDLFIAFIDAEKCFDKLWLDDVCKIDVATNCKDNLTEEERLALKELSENEDVIIKRADKSGNFVLLDKSFYRDQLVLEGHLATDSYQKISDNEDLLVMKNLKKTNKKA